MQHTIQMSEKIRIVVDVTEDYKVEGSFDPEAPSDLDYYGYRETHFEVVDMLELLGDRWMPVFETERDMYATRFEYDIILMVQDHLDEVAAKEAA